jgi:hypothetical protein
MLRLSHATTPRVCRRQIATLGPNCASLSAGGAKRFDFPEKLKRQSQFGRVSHSFRSPALAGRGWRGQHWMWVARVLKRSDDK